MANWTRNEPQSATQRRKWNLEDRTSLRNLGTNGHNCSPDIQYQKARQILQENNASDGDSSINYSLGIHWLLKASYDGHQGAIMLLSECYKNGCGITDRNISEVEACLAMTPAERVARKAARELFNCLSNGEQYITAAQLERKMRQIYKIQKRGPDQCSNGRNDQDISPYHAQRRHITDHRDNFTEEHLISAAMNYSNGRLPTISSALTLSIPHPETLNHIPCFHRLLFHPFMFIYLIYHKCLNTMALLPDLLTPNNCFLILLLFYTITTSTQNVLLLAPTALYYCSVLVMIVCTSKMFKSKHNFDDFRMWSRLFLSYDHHVDANDSENRFLRKQMQPYLLFFLAFFVNITLSPNIPTQWKLNSEITIVSFILLFVTMILFMYNHKYHPFPDPLVLTSFGINVLAKYPYEMDSTVISGWRFLDLRIPNFPSFLIGNGIEFCLNCRALLYLLIPGLLLMLARRRNWHGIYHFLIPHCVTLSWLQICIISSQSATMFGLVRAALGLSGSLLFLPLFGIVTLLIPVFVTIEWLSLTDSTNRLVASICMAAFVLTISCFMATYKRTEKYITVLQIAACVLATVFLTLPYMTKNFDNTPAKSTEIYNSLINNHALHETTESFTNLKWEAFHRYCYIPLSKSGNRINAQLKCDQFSGLQIKWEGIVSNVEINQVYNLPEKILTFLPNIISNLLTCWYGDRNQIISERSDNSEDFEYTSTIFNEQKKCNLHKWNVYEFHIKVLISSGLLIKPAEVILRAQHSFMNFSNSLNSSDRIWFKGILLKNDKLNVNADRKCNEYMDSNKPVIDLLGIGCLSCINSELESVIMPNKLLLNNRIKDLYGGLKYLLNVLFNPLIIFK